MCAKLRLISMDIHIFRQINLDVSPNRSLKEGPLSHPTDSKGSDQTGRMTRLNGVFAGRTVNFVGFIMRMYYVNLDDFADNS